MNLSISLSFAVIGLCVAIYRVLQIGKRDPRMPKGPPTVPVLGNAHMLPTTGLYKKMKEWTKIYGPVFSLKIGPSNTVVLCDRKAIHQLLLDENHFRVQEAEATVLMSNLCNNPDNFYSEIRRYTASVVTSITYGCRAPTSDSFWCQWTAAMEPGANPPVDVFTWLQYIPSSFAFWKRRAIDAGKTMDGTWGEARRRVEERRAKGEKRRCIVDTLLDEYEKKGWPSSIPQHAFTNLLGEIIEGGADTTAAQLLTLILAFALHPEVQAKAREEIDVVCGTERSPRWDDFSKLPYINCIVKEGMRWRPVAVTALPHKVRQDDEYQGMLIPKDSTIFIPTWAIHHNENIYKDPETFDPDRYAQHPRLANDYAGSPDWANRDHYNYGAGRRICPGIHLAERNMWRIASKLLWAFEFAEPTDPKTGEVMHLDPEAYNPGILQAPLPFKVSIKPRSEAHVATILREHEGSLEFLSQYS
ncbi:cytochrome P450 [Fusarium solani]|uniref:Cytochrome P450 n=1 Tax=Fusarium solani TaxID=169388 RepID=A0A9P9KPN1_FUSSL|nr:cytochrome P450 [Fusarium solani]KAH7264569.1 cytochrome P450 [Fusarium solani]